MTLEGVLWNALLWSPIVPLFVGFALGLADGQTSSRWLRIGLLLLAWAAVMAALLASGWTRVHGPDLAFLGLIFVTPAIACVYGIGRFVGRRRGRGRGRHS